ncbi:hypothetical protein F2Q69_00059148 [Brassica cretica]|uniref:Uncharacterized protein n=2 Tax=Brassica cretica TaxID=69181 RepID=A0ABQ7D9H1_BRACR|nr:hypothetical protein DY000_02016114 [Brassica cretica]KAF3572963.1 hypothetical protein F2Q69_00059148 [Brassica cretica]
MSNERRTKRRFDRDANSSVPPPPVRDRDPWPMENEEVPSLSSHVSMTLTLRSKARNA